ncbi:MAG: hypothetical protein RR838_03890 [Clostridium sp.]
MTTKELIKNELNKGESLKAKELIELYNEYYDLELYTLKGIYYFIEGDLEKAKNILLEGIKYQEYN